MCKKLWGITAVGEAKPGTFIEKKAADNQPNLLP